jgi:hypothetical protein
MSWNAVIEFEAACAEENTPEPPLDWLLAMLRQSMEELMASEAKPLPKANALARLASLYLKTCGAAGLTKENKALKRRLKELESSASSDAALTPASPAALVPDAAPCDPAPAALPGSPSIAPVPAGGAPVSGTTLLTEGGTSGVPR